MDTLLQPKPPTKPANQITGIFRPAHFFLDIGAPPRRVPWLSTQHLNHVLPRSPPGGCQSINPSSPLSTWVHK